MNSRSFFLAALIAGVAIGLLGNLPVLNLINCFLCIWVWVGGVLAVFLYRRFEHGAADLTGGRGAGLGALAGLIGAFVGVVVYALTSFISIPLFENLVQTFDIEGYQPWDARGLGGVLASALIFLVANVVLYPLFGALSGYITASLMKKQPPTTQ